MKIYENLETIIKLSTPRNDVSRDAWDKGPAVRFSKDPKTLRAWKAIPKTYSLELAFSYVV